MDENRSAFFRMKAEQCRQLASGPLSEQTRATLVELERNFDRLAEIAESSAPQQPDGNGS